MGEKNLKDYAYSLIKDKIVRCVYAPNTFLNEGSLSEEMNVSRTPVREALNRLEQENLVRIFPKRGVWITDISLSDVTEIHQVRDLLEPYIIRGFSQNIDREELFALKERLMSTEQPLQDSNAYQIDKDIHSLIIASSNNRYFYTLMENIYAQNHRLRILSGQKVESRLIQTQREHLAIVEKILENDFGGAAEAMEIHLANSKKAAIEGLFAR